MDSPDFHSQQFLVRRAQLPLPRPYAAPATPTERQLEAIWRTVLGMDQVGVNDRYNDLGGDSFQARTIFSMIEENFHLVIPMAALVEASTIAELSKRIDRCLIDSASKG
jgi:acyl carrier protein